VDDVRFHPEAQAEYQAALAWYQARSPQTAARFEAEMERLVQAVSANPRMFPVYDDDQRYAMLGRFPYSVVYRMQPDSVHVVAVAHSRRAAGYWRGRA